MFVSCQSYTTYTSSIIYNTRKYFLLLFFRKKLIILKLIKNLSEIFELIGCSILTFFFYLKMKKRKEFDMNRPSSSNSDIAKDTRLFEEMIETKCSSPKDVKALGETKTFGDIRVIFEDMQKNHETIPASIEDRDLPIGPKGNVNVRIVRPEGNYDKLPVIFFFHGGEWMKGSRSTHDRIIRTIANCVNAVIVFPNYSLSPESKFPTAINECYDVMKYVIDHAYEFNINPEKTAVAGDSAGGNIAAVMTLMAKEKGGPKIDYQVLLYPLTNANFNFESIEEFSNGPWITKNTLECAIEAYLENEADRNSKYVSPYLANCEELENLPSALIITAENDPLRDDGERYAKKLNECGVQASCVRFCGTIHGFMVFDGLKDTEAARFAMNLMCNALKNKLK